MKKIEDIKEFEDIDTYYEISKIVEEVFQDRVEVHKHLVTANKEIERLKIIEEKYKDSQLYIHDFKEEIERLNNIINELEKWLKQQYGLDKEEWEYSSPYIWHEHITLEFVLNKLQELKGSE